MLNVLAGFHSEAYIAETYGRCVVECMRDSGISLHYSYGKRDNVTGAKN